MENDDKRKDGQEIDEQHLMSIMAGGTSKVSLVKEVESLQEKQVPKERGKSKRSLDEAYGERFLNTHTMTKRGDKSIYIRSEYHERLSRIVQVIGEDRIPLYAYLDNILEHHFDLFEKAITDDFNKKYKPIF